MMKITQFTRLQKRIRFRYSLCAFDVIFAEKGPLNPNREHHGQHEVMSLITLNPITNL